MLGPMERAEIEKGMRTLWILWVAMFASLWIYVFLCHLMEDHFRRAVSPAFPTDLLRNILYAVAILTLLLAHFLRRAIVSGRFIGTEVNLLRSSSVSDQPPVVGRYATAVIISLALAESVGIYGLVLFLLGDNFQTLYVFIAVSALAMFFFRPKMEEIERLALAVRGR